MKAALASAIIAGMALLAGCAEASDGYASLPTQYQDAQSRALAAGQTAEALGDYLRATEAAVVYQTAAAGEMQERLTQQARATQTAEAYATVTAQANLAFEATMAAASTQSALTVRQRELDLQAQQDALDYQRKLFDEKVKREELHTRMDQFGETAKATALIVLLYVSPILAVLGGLGVGIYSLIKSIGRKARLAQVVERGPHGLLPAVIDADGRVHVLDRQFWSTYDPKLPKDVAPTAQALLNDGITRVQGVAALAAGGRPPSVRSVAQTFQMPASTTADAQGEVDEVFNAEWRWLDHNWRPGQGFVMGMGKGGGAITIDPEKDPHVLIAGTTSSGKTLEGARTIAATALASGWQVVVANGAAADYEALSVHPNFYQVTGGPERMAELLERVAQLVDERDQYLAAHHATTWNRLPNGEHGPRVMIIVDELVALTWQAQVESPRLAARLWSAAIRVTSKGRKMGISLVIISTDPTYRTLGRPGLTVRDNCARLVFKLRDRAVSQAALDMDGAETLKDHQFLAQMRGTVLRGMSFQPTVEELGRFLDAYRGQVFERPHWLALPDPDGKPNLSEKEQQIVELWEQGLTMNEIERRVFGYTGGTAHTVVRAVTEKVLGSTTTDESGDSRGSAA